MSKNNVVLLVLVVAVVSSGLTFAILENNPQTQNELLSNEINSENLLEKKYPAVCTDDENDNICNTLFEFDLKEFTNWTVSNNKCEGSKIEVVFDDYKFIEFIVISKSLQPSASNVNEFQISDGLQKISVELGEVGDDLTWIDLNSNVLSLELEILNLYEGSPVSNNCGINEISFYGREN